MQAWKKKKGILRQPHYTVVFEPIEREVLGDLSATVSEALIQRTRSAPKDELSELTGIPNGNREAPQDPALARLLPDFEREGDEEYEGDNAFLRSLHETDISREKIANIQVINKALGPDGSTTVTVSEDEVDAWLSGLNDLRLYVAAGNIVGGEQAERERDQLVEWMAFNQESLLNAVMDN